MLKLCLFSIFFLALTSKSEFSSMEQMSEFLQENDAIFPQRGINGYVGITDNPEDNQYFYWFFESRADPQNDPLLFWFTGGPGCPGGIALLFENGPFKFAADRVTLINNPYAWNSNANIVFMDQPLGVGFSFGEVSKYAANADMIRDYMYQFIVGWLEIDHFQRFKGHPFYIFGESYGGHYVPQISNRFYTSGNPDINLKGVGIGNGWFASEVQFKSYPKFAQANPEMSVKQSHIDSAMLASELGEHLIKHTASPFIALDMSTLEDVVTNKIIGDKVAFNVYNYKIKCIGDLCYDLNYLAKFMNRKDVRSELKISPKKGEWQTANGVAGDLLNLHDHHTDSSIYLRPMLDGGVKVLLYTGTLDWICNWKGTEDILNRLNWSGKAEWLKTPYKKGKYGYEKEVFNLRFVRFSNCGHMVPHDHPQLALEMLNEFIHDK